MMLMIKPTSSRYETDYFLRYKFINVKLEFAKCMFLSYLTAFSFLTTVKYSCSSANSRWRPTCCLQSAMFNNTTSLFPIRFLTVTDKTESLSSTNFSLQSTFFSGFRSRMVVYYEYIFIEGFFPGGQQISSSALMHTELFQHQSFF